MPIKPENKSKYPSDWKQIRERILARAENKCEQCRVPNRAFVARSADAYMLRDGSVFDAETGESRGMSRGSEFPSIRYVEIVLTIAHLDHDPTNCDEANLRAWCQMHHLRYDQPHHRANSFETRRRGKAAGELF
jgi:hypothetical protein